GKASEFIPGEGAAAVVLKRKDDALRDGDRIYAVIKGLAPQWADAYERGQSLGNAEPDIGHTGAASGLAGLVKACLGLYQEILPHQPGKGSQYWLRNRADGPRRAAVNAVNFTGQSFHVALEASELTAKPTKVEARPQPLGARLEGLFAVEADTVTGLRERVRQLAEWSA